MDQTFVSEESVLYEIICKTCQKHLLYSESQIPFSKQFPEFEICRRKEK